MNKITSSVSMAVGRVAFRGVALSVL